MPLPTDKKTHGFRFSDDLTFFQKAVILHPHEDKFLIVKRVANDKVRPGTWDLPGGNILYGELHSEGLRREIFEEAGLHVSTPRIVHLITKYDNSLPMYYIVAGFLAKAQSVEVVLSHEHSEYQWITKEEFLQLDPRYKFVEERVFDGNSTDFLRDIVSCAFTTF